MLVVLILVATLGLLGARATDQLVRADRAFAKVDATATDLAFALAQLRADLNAAMPLPFHPPNGSQAPALTILN